MPEFNPYLLWQRLSIQVTIHDKLHSDNHIFGGQYIKCTQLSVLNNDNNNDDDDNVKQSCSHSMKVMTMYVDVEVSIPAFCISEIPLTPMKETPADVHRMGVYVGPNSIRIRYVREKPSTLLRTNSSLVVILIIFHYR